MGKQERRAKGRQGKKQQGKQRDQEDGNVEAASALGKENYTKGNR